MEQLPNHPDVSGFFSNTSMKIAPNIGRLPSGLDKHSGSNDASLFSSSLPVLPHERLNLTGLEHELRAKELIRELSYAELEKLLPDEEELLAGIADDFDLSGLPNQAEDVEDGDIFGNGGGLELDLDPLENLNMSMANTSVGDLYSGNGGVNYSVVNGEHPLGEHPSRTLFVRNINSSVEDSELRALFEQYGDIRTLYTACKHRGFVMISYYDIRAARTAMRALQNTPVRRRKLDIHYSIPKDNPPEKDINQGTLVIFNLDPSVTNENVRQIFGAYGEVKEIRETPHKRHHKFIEFYDIRAAEAALRSLNRTEIAGKRIKLEHSRPGGARRNLIQQSNQDFDCEDRSCRQVGSPLPSSPPGSWAQFNSPIDNSPLRALKQSPKFGVGIPMINNRMHGIDSLLSPSMSNSLNIASNGNDHYRARSFPENSDILPSLMSSKFGNLSSMGSANPIGKINGAQFHWSSQIPHSEHAQTSTRSASSKKFEHGYSSIASPCFHVGSAPPGVHFEGSFSHFSETPESSFMNLVSSRNMITGRTSGNMMMNSGSQGIDLSNNMHDFRMMPSPIYGNFPYSLPGIASFEKSDNCNRNGRRDGNESQVCTKQYELNLENIVSGEDTRTTLMLKNIPNKYTSKMLLATIDENHKGTYDFLYLPIDFKNKCNVGYAFINMVFPSQIVPFYKEFNGKKWLKFNSEKVASLAYARIQGKTALVNHFQNSSVMNEDRKCRPILFHSEEHGALDQELFTSNGLNVYVRNQDESCVNYSAENLTKMDDMISNGNGSAEDTLFSWRM